MKLADLRLAWVGGLYKAGLNGRMTFRVVCGIVGDRRQRALIQGNLSKCNAHTVRLSSSAADKGLGCRQPLLK